MLSMANTEVISMKFHPRAFAAFGADLVTNDTVAITELVKNCYDAFAYNVEVEFGEDAKGKYIQITDDGIGMTGDIIKNSWAVIATPYKQNNPTIERDEQIRRVSGNKGLGRFSAARLGDMMLMWTKSADDSCLRAKMDWRSFLESSNVEDCRITIKVLSNKEIFNPTGTIIRIRKLSSNWDKDKVDELRDNLSRLISPFKQVERFSIKLISPFYESPIQIRTTDLIEKPLYKIVGIVNKTGQITWKYSFDPKNKDLQPRKHQGSLEWNEAKKGFATNVVISDLIEQESSYIAGPFSFEIRAWDLDNDSLEDLTNTFNLKRRAIRNTIGQYKGLSIYRDNVLVLPKSDASKDWLGIDLRRISSLGKRISTSQIIGIINISSADNPEIRDTTDREKLVDTQEYNQFTKIIETVVSLLENLRFNDKEKDKGKDNASKKHSLSSLIAPLSAQILVKKIESAVEHGAKHQDILEFVYEYHNENEKGLTILQDRLTYYAQTASLGSIAIVILHEMLTGLTVIKRFLRRVFKQYSPFDSKTQEYYDDAEQSHARLMDVAKSFAPLYRRDLHTTKNRCDLKDTLEKSIRLIRSQKNSTDVSIDNKLPSCVNVKMHHGELQTVFINLLDNACYWLQKSGGSKILKISCESQRNSRRLSILVSDNGIGISKEDAQSIFEPGVTAKPYGIGMGLVIVTEILDYYEGKIATIIPGLLGGATFVFDIPID